MTFLPDVQTHSAASSQLSARLVLLLLAVSPDSPGYSRLARSGLPTLSAAAAPAALILTTSIEMRQRVRLHEYQRDVFLRLLDLVRSSESLDLSHFLNQRASFKLLIAALVTIRVPLEG